MRPEQKKRVLWPFLVTILQIMHWVPSASRPFPHEVQFLNSLQPGWESKEVCYLMGNLHKAPLFGLGRGWGDGFNGKKMELGLNEEEFKGLGTPGSRPPNCDNKCGGCSPCEAAQVPTTTDHLGIQYSNYEPEGWKCKCGPSFYNP